MNPPIETRTTDKASAHRADWERVREAITRRWPHLSREQLDQCPDDSRAITEFVKPRVEASDEEIESVVGEFAPDGSVIDQVAQATEDRLNQAGESTRFALMHPSECIANRPTESVMTSFVAGVALGVTVATLWFNSHRKPSVWDRVRDNSWD